jgi:hypothetical protein
MRKFTTHCPRICHTTELQMRNKRTLAVRIQSMRGAELRTGSVRAMSFANVGHRAKLRLAYIFESGKLLNPANQADPFYIL